MPAIRPLTLLSMVLLAPTLLLPVNSSAQSCHTDSMPETTPTTQFVIHGDGTVTDTTTALMWKQCPQGLSDIDCSNGNAELTTWDLALQSANNLNNSGGFAGYADWRLPNISELSSLAEEQCAEPAINLTVFPNTSSQFFWSASPDANNDSATWFVDFNIGGTGSVARDGLYPVRLVRSIR